MKEIRIISVKWETDGRMYHAQVVKGEKAKGFEDVVSARLQEGDKRRLGDRRRCAVRRCNIVFELKDVVGKSCSLVCCGEESHKASDVGETCLALLGGLDLEVDRSEAEVGERQRGEEGSSKGEGVHQRGRGGSGSRGRG